jgi:hypothetical protein
MGQKTHRILVIKHDFDTEWLLIALEKYES